MVRRDEADRVAAEAVARSASRCVSPAGASPAPVSAKAPGSRPQARGEILAARAGRQEPLRREQERGPQHEVKPAASSEKQWGRAVTCEVSASRAAHVTAKATSGAQELGAASDPRGRAVGGEARSCAPRRWRRDWWRWPARRSLSEVRPGHAPRGGGDVTGGGGWRGARCRR